MENTIYNILTGIGISGIFVVVIFYLKVKKIIESDIVKPLIEPLEKDIKDLKDELKKKDDKLEKISEIINKNTETLNELKTIFNLIKNKIEISFKED
jgi:beta-lactamase regulating signal transducer with metallopeptidase domain